ncbi:MAG TPA: transcription elongation factor GreA [Rectinemataceae bacterium]|nr:transcription elongation factor GreA [Rectinemataceae bacterium]
MAESQLAQKIQDMLNEEKWTRAALSAYSVANLKELDALLQDAIRDKATEEIKTLCDEHLGHTKTSVIALYLSGVISLMRQQLDDSSMVALIDIFADNKRWNIVEFVCQRMLDYGENRTALRRLAECYESEERSDDKYTVWERLVRVDYEEADIVKALAERREKEGKTDEAVDFYKKALHRFINKGLGSNVKEIWTKLLEYCPQDIDFFLHVQRKIAKQLSEDKAAGLLLDLYRHYKAAEDWNTALDILRVVIEYDEKNPSLRKEVVECYRGKYKEHSHLDDYIRLSNITQSYRAIHEAMADFEKHIAFDAGNFVYHRTWNIGRIASIKGDDIVIDFAKSRGHKMSLKMAIDSLTSLAKEHIWVLKAVWSKDKLREKVKDDPAWALRIIIKSFDNRADLKRIKAELVPSVLTVSEWNSWSTKARDILKTDPIFGNATDDIATFIVRDRPLSFEEKVYNQFKAEKSFFARVQYLRDFLKSGEPDSEFFTEMFAFFSGFVRSYQAVNEMVVSSYLLLKDLAAKYPHLKAAATTGFAELFEEIDDPVAIYDSIKDTELKHAFLTHIKNFVPDWPDVYIRIFPYSLNAGMLETLKSSGHEDKLKRMVLDIIENYRDHREAFIWVVKNLKDESWFSEMGLAYEKILITLVHILDISFKEIESHRDTTENRKINKQVQTILFKDAELETFLLESPPENIERVYTLVSEVKDLDPAVKLSLRRKIMEKWPEFKFGGEEEKQIVSRGLMVTADKFEEKQRLLTTILDVEVPENQKEIAYALSLGDLRENAEYKAAKEKQDEINAKVAKLKNEIERAQLFDKSTISTAKISFGTMVTLTNEISGQSEVYTILGPWESDPSNNVISYLSPLGKKLLNHKPGERLNFTIHERKFQYKVEKIEAVRL